MFRFLARFVSMSGIGGIAQSVATNLLARLADPDLSDEEFKKLQDEAAEQGFILSPA
jgi:hypothetical protein